MLVEEHGLLEARPMWKKFRGLGCAVHLSAYPLNVTPLTKMSVVVLLDTVNSFDSRYLNAPTHLTPSLYCTPCQAGITDGTRYEALHQGSLLGTLSVGGIHPPISPRAKPCLGVLGPLGTWTLGPLDSSQPSPENGNYPQRKAPPDYCGAFISVQIGCRGEP